MKNDLEWNGYVKHQIQITCVASKDLNTFDYLLEWNHSFSDDFDAPQEARRTIVYTLDFEMKVNFYGPTQRSDIIRKKSHYKCNQKTKAENLPISI